MMLDPGDPAVKIIGDATGVGLVIAAWQQYLPAVATFLSIIWFGLRIIEASQVMWYKHKAQKKVDVAMADMKTEVQAAVDRALAAKPATILGAPKDENRP